MTSSKHFYNNVEMDTNRGHDEGVLDEFELNEITQTPWRSIDAAFTCPLQEVAQDEFNLVGSLTNSFSNKADESSQRRFFIKFSVHRGFKKALSLNHGAAIEPGYVFVITDLESVWISKMRGKQALLQEIARSSPSLALNDVTVALSHLDQALARWSPQTPKIQLQGTELTNHTSTNFTNTSQSHFSEGTRNEGVHSSYLCAYRTYKTSINQTVPSAGLDVQANLCLDEALIKWTFRCDPLSQFGGRKMSREQASAKFILKYWVAPLTEAASQLTFYLSKGLYIRMCEDPSRWVYKIDSSGEQVYQVDSTHAAQLHAFGKSFNVAAVVNLGVNQAAERDKKSGVVKSNDVHEQKYDNTDPAHNIKSAQLDNATKPTEKESPMKPSSEVFTSHEYQSSCSISALEVGDSKEMHHLGLGSPRPFYSSSSSHSYSAVSPAIAENADASYLEEKESGLGSSKELERRQALEKLVATQQKAKQIKKKRFV